MSDGDDDATEPFPPRFRQLKRWTVRALVVLALLGGMRAWWGYEARRRFDLLVAEAHARGEKILPEDFVGEPLPPGKNAAALWQAAAAGITYTPQQQAWESNFTRTLPLGAADVAAIEGLAWQNRQALAQVRQARAIVDADWGIRPSWQAFALPMGLFNQQRHLATTLMYVTLYQHEIGNDAEAVELLLDLDAQYRAVGRVAPFVVTLLTSAGLESLLAELTIDLAPTMDVARERGPSATTRPVTRDRLRHLIERLLDDSDARQLAAHAWEGETMLALDMSSTFGNRLQPAPLYALLRPLHVLDGVRAARWRGRHRSAVTQPTLAAADAMLPSRSADGRKSHLHEGVTVLSETSKHPLRLNEVRFRVLADRRAAAILLATRMYMLDHGGQLPPTLDALVPRYLPRMPADPMSPQERPFRYLPNAPRPCLYSVGTNFSDNGGWSANANRWDARNLDAIYLLPRPAAAGAAATSAATRSGS